jgi:hypothetical protein
MKANVAGPNHPIFQYDIVPRRMLLHKSYLGILIPLTQTLGFVELESCVLSVGSGLDPHGSQPTFYAVSEARNLYKLSSPGIIDVAESSHTRILREKRASFHGLPFFSLIVA